MSEFIKCEFIPQAWVNDFPMQVDDSGANGWFVLIKDVAELTGVALSHLDDDPYARDNLRYAKTAPQWVKDWSGPFEVEFEEVLQS